MNVIVIGKPRIDETLIVDNYYNEGENKNILDRNIIPGGLSVYVACMLSKWGLNVSYQGMIGGEEEGLKIKSKLEEYKINTKFLEITYEKKSNKNYSVLNKTIGKRTNYIYDNELFTLKHKFDFTPDYIVTDGTDMPGAIGASNNYSNVPIIMLANKNTKEMYNLTKRSKYVIATEEFASEITKMKINYNKSKTLVDMMQKLQDLEAAKYTLMLKGHGTLFVNERQVKYIPKIEVNIVDEYMQEAAFFGAYAYGIINNINLDNTAKLANMAASKAMEKIGNIDNILEKNDIYNACSITEQIPNENTPVEEIPTIIPQQPTTTENIETISQEIEIPKVEEGSNVQQ